MTKHGVPDFIVKDGLLTIHFHPGDRAWMIDKLRSKIRRNSHEESVDLIVLRDTAVLSRLCYGLASTDSMVNISREDIEILMRIHYESHLSWFENQLRENHTKVKICGIISPVWADELAKDVQSVMTS